MASYQGSPFEAGIGPSDGDIVLFAACPPPEELGFEPATGHWRKQLRLNDVQAVWESRPVGTFRGERCMVLDDLGDRLHIGYLGHDGFRAEQLGYWQVDRGVFELVAPRTEVIEISEERTEYRRPLTGPQPVMPPPGAGLADPATPATPGTGSYPAPEVRNSAGYQIPLAAPQPAAYRPIPADAEPAMYQPTSGPEYGARSDSASGQYRTLTGYGAPASDSEAAGGYLAPSPGLPVPDDSTGIALPLTTPAPLPLEAEAMRAASAARRPRPTAGRGGNAIRPDQPGPASQLLAQPVTTGPEVLPPSLGTATPAAAFGPDTPAAPASPAAAASPAMTPPVSTSPAARPATASPAMAPPVGTGSAARPATASPALARTATASPPPAVTTTTAEPMKPAAPAAAPPAAPTATPIAPPAAPTARPRRAARRRMATERLFGDLASLAGIPADSYAVGEDVEGALCLVQTQHGFEVFHSAGGARHELQVFTTEEAACFYLFGVLAAEAVRNGSLARAPASLGTREA